MAVRICQVCLPASATVSSLRPQGRCREGSDPPPGVAKPAGKVRDEKRLHILQ